jgi:hypothetical protein
MSVIQVPAVGDEGSSRRSCQRIGTQKSFTNVRGYLYNARLPTVGAIAQLGERLHGMQEVVGSIPTSSTIVRTQRPHRLEA